MKSLIERGECPMRHENGNCTVAGGFCTAVNDAICEALHNAFRCGEDAERERTVLMLADINEKYAQRNLKVLKQIHEKVTAPIEELQAELDKYKKAEAEGLAIYPPCKVGDTIWLTGWWDVCTWVSKLSSPIERRIRYFSIESDGVYAHVKDGCINAKYFGEIVFLTKEAAEKALEGMKNEA